MRRASALHKRISISVLAELPEIRYQILDNSLEFLWLFAGRKWRDRKHVCISAWPV
jgi:hypothetical protein